MKHLFLLLLLMATLFHCTPSRCAAVENDADSMEKAVETIKKAAEQGDATAQYKLGVLYNRGVGMMQHSARACYWYQKAAEQGHMKAQYMLGLMFLTGEGVERDYARARQWWEKAAAQKNPSAEALLGSLYEHGEGVEKDLATAREWYDAACRGGFQEACTARERLNSRQ